MGHKNSKTPYLSSFLAYDYDMRVRIGIIVFVDCHGNNRQLY